jgi:Tol biopolymer transport system component
VTPDDTVANDATITPDGRYVVFSAITPLGPPYQLFLRDRQTGTTTRLVDDVDGGMPSGPMFSAAITPDGRFIAFLSFAPDLVADDTNGRGDWFVHDRQTGVTERVSVKSDGSQSDGSGYARAAARSAISADGRYVAFEADDPALVAGDGNDDFDVFVHDRQTGATELVSRTASGLPGNALSGTPAMSADGRYVAFHSRASDLVSGDGNGTFDVFVHDRQVGTTTVASVSSGGAVGNGPSATPSLSADGQTLAFLSNASNLALDGSRRASAPTRSCATSTPARP